MPIEILMPKLGLTMKDGTVVSWLKSEGESIAEKEVVLDIETEKLSYSVESPASGVLLKRLADVGEKYPVSAVLGFVGQPGEELPDIHTKVIGKADAPIVAGAQKSDMGSMQYQYGVSGKEAVHMQASVSQDGYNTGSRVFISPLAKKIAAEKGIDYRQIKGTGPNGRIVKADVAAFSTSSGNNSAAGRLKTHQSDDKPMQAANQNDTYLHSLQSLQGLKGTLVPYAGLRRAVGETMKHAWETIPMVTHQVSANAAALNDFRALLNTGIEDSSARVTIGEILIKLTAAALALMPIINSSLTDDGIMIHGSVNIGMATAIDSGLIVPVIQDADKKGLLTVSQEAKGLATRARGGMLTPDDVHGATFTLSNLGGYGSVDFFTPIINPPQAAILGVGRIADAVAVVDGEIMARPTIGLSLTYDHRIIDGATAASFIRILMQLMENPARSVLN